MSSKLAETVLAGRPRDIDIDIDGLILFKKQQRYFKIAFPLTTGGIGLCFSSFLTYVTFQIQTIAFFVGHEPGMPPGSGCSLTATACLVPFVGSGSINLTSYLLYLQAIVYAVSGVFILLISGFGDRFKHQREQYVFWTVLYGGLCLPVASLRNYSIATINTFAGLYVVFNIVGFIAGTYMNCFIPFAMQQAPETPTTESGGSVITAGDKEKTGLSLSVWGYNGLYVGQMVPLILVAGLTYAATVTDAGLYMTTACGAVCIVSALSAMIFLPRPGKDSKTEQGTYFNPFTAIKTFLKGIRQYPEAFKYLVAFTIYNDCLFAFIAVNGQLFNIQVRPTLREYSIYSLVQPITSIISSIIFLGLFTYFPRKENLSLKTWTTACYILTMLCAIWVALGISGTSKIGLKRRWEFYVVQVLISIANAIVAAIFRVLFPQMFPVGNEVQFFGFQLAFSCLTVWIPQVS